MKFSKFSEYLEKLEATSKRLELIDIMARLLGEASGAEVGKICYLLQGRVAPFYQPIEFGMSENLVAVAVGRAFEKNKEEVVKDYKKRGNMGTTAKLFAEKSKVKSQKSKLTVSEVFNELLKTANTGGEG